MRKVCAALTVAVFVLALGAVAFAATQTISGQLIDQTCYKMNSSNSGVDHKMPSGDVKDCAITCAKMGRPLALLTADGKVYTVTGDLAANNNAKLVPHMSHKVELTGDVTETGGTMTIAATSLKMISK
ncbi:MAG: hypothetical protein DMG32_11230 [Acidobacteria bacterium]|nr:MAG: hypothetical protein DMG32_11230 [Acidobacteriota bacterium]